MRELKRQLEERDLLVEKLHDEVKDAGKARDEVYIAKQELIAAHQVEQGVSFISNVHPNITHTHSVLLTGIFSIYIKL